MRKFATILSVVVMIATLLATPAYARGGHGRSGCAKPMYKSTQRVASQDYAQRNGIYCRNVNAEEIKVARNAYLDSLVADGIITQNHADIALEHHHGMFAFCDEHGDHGKHGCFTSLNWQYDAENDNTASYKIDIEALTEARAEYLDLLVARGVITQEDAAISLEHYCKMLEFCVENGYCGHGGYFCEGNDGCIGFGGY